MIFLLPLLLYPQIQTKVFTVCESLCGVMLTSVRFVMSNHDLNYETNRKAHHLLMDTFNVPKLY